MNKVIKEEFIEFEKYHKNIYNIYFHILCGFIFMTFLFLLSKKYSYILLSFYTLLILFTTHNFLISFYIYISIYFLIYFIKQFNFNKTITFVLFFIFYFLPDLSHFLTNEPSMLNMDNLTPLSLFTNIFYLLPFSLLCLSNSS
jgi:hypothetical protein